MSLEAQILGGLRAALLLGQGKEEGLRFAHLSMRGAVRSFWAGLFCLVPFLLIRAQSSEVLVHVGLPAELIGYVLGWVIFPLASVALVDASGRGPLWPLMVAAWNWANLAQYAALLAASLFGAFLPPGLSAPLILAAFGYAIWLEWFVVKAALRISGIHAGLFVLLDMALGLFIASVVQRLAG
ncbi:hypothetical protein [Roseomonas xinghualingensis]|uniref:hypothetical protein n=1 Tax=Roseomonas xinghualingensis TaxID=2986475 RepID=UPI0021F17959|nr:hypothetical protein [Roseomonas sp. SXEYE001]MCV4208058.1 hypothetical protein [Roseomonas sp. SXEYE001]